MTSEGAAPDKARLIEQLEQRGCVDAAANFRIAVPGSPAERDALERARGSHLIESYVRRQIDRYLAANGWARE